MVEAISQPGIASGPGAKLPRARQMLCSALALQAAE